MKDTREIPDTIYLALLGEKRFRFFDKLREYAENKMQLKLWYVDTKSRRGNYYLYFDKGHETEKDSIEDCTVLTFAMTEFVLNCEACIDKDVWRKIKENREDFSEATQKSIQFDIDNSLNESKKCRFGVQVRNQQSVDDVLRVLAWQREYHEENQNK